MNLNIALAIISLVVGVSYLIVTQIKASKYNMPFFKALNPNYTARVHELAGVRTSLQPIIDEIETKRLSDFILSWKIKFEKDTFSPEDVKKLNLMIADGAKNQVDGILSLHPDARNKFDQINEQLIAEEVTEAELVN